MSRMAASRVPAPAAALSCALLLTPLVLVDVLLDWFDWPEELVKSSASPVDKIIPVSLGVTPGATVSPFV